MWRRYWYGRFSHPPGRSSTDTHILALDIQNLPHSLSLNVSSPILSSKAPLTRPSWLARVSAQFSQKWVGVLIHHLIIHILGARSVTLDLDATWPKFTPPFRLYLEGIGKVLIPSELGGGDVVPYKTKLQGLLQPRGWERYRFAGMGSEAHGSSWHNVHILFTYSILRGAVGTCPAVIHKIRILKALQTGTQCPSALHLWPVIHQPVIQLSLTYT
jgi:hypothetical protein